jgi:ribosome maturation factor RimP
MSGSSRHGSVRPSADAGRTGQGSRTGQGDRQSQGNRAGGRTGPGGRPGAHGDAAAEAERVAQLLQPVVSAVGMDLEGVRITAAGRRRLLRIMVDADGGVGLDDIAVVSRELSAELDASTVMGDFPYTLEVSSPGVDRPLTERRHWRRAIGRLVIAPLTADPGDGRFAEGTAGATVEGRVMGASAAGITLEVAGESREFGYGDLGPGKIKIEFARIGADLDDEDAGDDQADDEGADEEGSDGY